MLELANVVKRFGETVAVDDVSMCVETGAIVALIGPNGAGKSTTFRLISGLAQPDEGQILWDGQPLKGALAKEHFGFLPEERGLYQRLEVEQLLGYWARLRAINHCRIAAVLDYWISRFELGSRRNALVSSLSKGNQQKLQLAVCLMHSPKLLVLDEPFSGLDPINQDLVSEILLEQAGSGAAVLISAHQLALVERVANKVMLMHAGRAAALPAFGNDGERKADELEREVVVHISAGARLWLGALPPHEVISVAAARVTLAFPPMGLHEFTDALAALGAMDDVLDLEVSRSDLHRAYVKAVTSNAHGVDDGSSRP